MFNFYFLVGFIVLFACIMFQKSTWFTMGCALLQLEEYERAADAFRRCVGLDWDVSAVK